MIACTSFIDKLAKTEQASFVTKLYSKFLKEVEMRWYEIGVLLGVPFSTLDLVDTRHDRLKEVVEVRGQNLNTTK